uniref:Salivary lipocalin n=1 Tax=Triatoma dimidiata TaxID=72491 RepID=D1MWE4_TRIDM|nr:hypothetical protein Td46 similar to triabin-like lipocalin 4a precursor [Triatoma dimidiata]
MKTIIAVTFFAILTYAHANSGVDGKCQNKQGMENFDSGRYFTGIWYLTHAMNGSESTVCRQFEYKQKDGQLEVNAIKYKKKDKSEYFSFDNCNVNQKSDENGKFSLDCTRVYDVPDKANKNFHVERTVLKTDYDNYAIVYRCVTTKDGKSHFKENMWVLHRDKGKDIEDSSILGISKKDYSRSIKNIECKERQNP